MYRKRPLIPTPDDYSLGIEQPFAKSLPQELRTVDVKMLYATDRMARPRQDGRLDYGLSRAPTLAFGEAVVSIGGDTSWEELARDARSGDRGRRPRTRALHLDPARTDSGTAGSLTAKRNPAVRARHKDQLRRRPVHHRGAFGHNYFRSNPAVASDPVLTIRYDRPPAAENGPPLEHVEDMFWKIDDDYLKSPGEK